MKKFCLLFAMLAVLCTACDDDENLNRDPRLFTIDDSGKLNGITNKYVIVTVPEEMTSLDVKMVSDGKISFDMNRVEGGVSANQVAGYTFEDGVIQDYIAYTREAKKKPRYLQAITINVPNKLVAKKDTAEVALNCVLPGNADKDCKAIIALVGGKKYNVETQNLTTEQLKALKEKFK